MTLDGYISNLPDKHPARVEYHAILRNQKIMRKMILFGLIWNIGILLVPIAYYLNKWLH
jgi:hypothetical protein